MSRTFQVVAYRDIPTIDFTASLADIMKPRSVAWICPKRPTFVSGATARSAAEPACTKFGVHYSDLQLKPWETAEFPDNAEHLNPPPVRSLSLMGSPREIEHEIKRMREESYRKLRPGRKGKKVRG